MSLSWWCVRFVCDSVLKGKLTCFLCQLTFSWSQNKNRPLAYLARLALLASLVQLACWASGCLCRSTQHRWVSPPFDVGAFKFYRTRRGAAVLHQHGHEDRKKKRGETFHNLWAAQVLTLASGVLKLVVCSCRTLYCLFKAATFTLQRLQMKMFLQSCGQNLSLTETTVFTCDLKNRINVFAFFSPEHSHDFNLWRFSLDFLVHFVFCLQQPLAKDISMFPGISWWRML